MPDGHTVGAAGALLCTLSFSVRSRTCNAGTEPAICHPSVEQIVPSKWLFVCVFYQQTSLLLFVVMLANRQAYGQLWLCWPALGMSRLLHLLPPSLPGVHVDLPKGLSDRGCNW